MGLSIVIFKKVEKIRSFSDQHVHTVVENGHNLVRGGQVVGWVPGKHMMEQTRNEYQDVIPERFEKQIEFFDAHKDISILGSWFEIFPKYQLINHPEKVKYLRKPQEIMKKIGMNLKYK